MEPFILTKNHSIAGRFLAELREVGVQKDRMRFRNNLMRLGEILAYEISKSLPYATHPIETPLGTATAAQPATEPTLLGILRAGLPFLQGFMNFFDRADVGFIGAAREEMASSSVTVKLDYLATPALDERVVILVDPMLATGKSMQEAVLQLMATGRPAHLHLASLVATAEGMANVEAVLSGPHSFWTCAVDPQLDQRFYIVPGLGDAGDLSFGEKKGK